MPLRFVAQGPMLLGAEQMSLVTVQDGLLFPEFASKYPTSTSATATIDATGEKYAMIGRLYINGRPAGTKTLSTGKINWRSGAITFADGGTTVDIGIQGVAASVGPIPQPDNTFTVKATLTGGGGGITANAWLDTTMNSGSANFSHGQLIAVVWDMVARGGADSVTITSAATATTAGIGSAGLPNTNAFVAGAWQTVNGLGAGRIPIVGIVFDDLTLGWIFSTFPISSTNVETWIDTSTPDERGHIFQVPFNCQVDAFWAGISSVDVSSSFSLNLYSDPTGSPSLLKQIAFGGGSWGVANTRGPIQVPFDVPVALTKDTDYMVSIRSTGTTNIGSAVMLFAEEAYRASITNGLTLKKATRSNDTGAFSPETPALTFYPLGVRICSFYTP